MRSKVATRDGWERVRFGDIVRLSTERCTDPAAAGIDRYVGLEHLEPGDPRIRTWGNVADGVTFTNRFRPGQVLFGKRRAYQRKVAVAAFDGICSSDIYVFEPVDDRLLPDLLPFICQTDGFFEHAIKTSAGSLSPRTNWSSLADYEFDLPPLATQQRLTNALTAAEQCMQTYAEARVRLTEVRHALEIHLFGNALGLPNDRFDLRMAQPGRGWQLLSGQDLLDQGFVLAIQDGNHGSQYPRADELGDEGLPYISAADISNTGGIDLAICRRIRPERAAALRIPNARSGDVILTNNATVGRVTRLPEWPTEIVASTSTTYYRCNEAFLEPEYLRWFLESALFQHQLRTIMRQSTRNQVPITTQKKLLFAVPERQKQKELAKLRNHFLDADETLKVRCEVSRTLRHAFVEKEIV